IAVPWWQRLNVECKTDGERDRVVAEFEQMWKECRGASQDVLRLHLAAQPKKSRGARTDDAAVPPAIATLSNPEFRDAAARCWRACRRLLTIIDDWHRWFNDLRATGDAEPGLPLRWSEESVRLIRVLILNHATMPPFDQGDAARIADMLPALPSPALGWQEEM